MNSVATTAKPSAGTIWRNGSIAAIVAVVVNAVLYFIGAALGGFPPGYLSPMGQPINLVAVIGFTIFTILVGTLVYIVLNRFVANPNLWFVVITGVVFVLMFFGPVTLPNAPMLMIVLLELMHVVTAGAAIYFLTRSR